MAKSDHIDTISALDTWLSYGIGVHRRVIMIDEEIDEVSCGFAIRAIDFYETMNPEKPIEIIINSPGGYVYDALALYDRIKESSCPISTKAIGKTMSAGTIIYCAGNIRTASKNATFMIHSLSSYTEGKVSDMYSDIKECKRLYSVMSSIYSEATGKPKEFFKKWMRTEDRWLDVLAAFDMGFVNELPSK